jgi:hypothetical protein
MCTKPGGTVGNEGAEGILTLVTLLDLSISHSGAVLCFRLVKDGMT